MEKLKVTNKDGRFKLRWRYKMSRTNHHLIFISIFYFFFPLFYFYFYLFSAVKQFVEFLHAQNFFLFVERKKTNETDDNRDDKQPVIPFPRNDCSARNWADPVSRHFPTFLRK